jgi:hypothetical protein
MPTKTAFCMPRLSISCCTSLATPWKLSDGCWGLDSPTPGRFSATMLMPAAAAAVCQNTASCALEGLRQWQRRIGICHWVRDAATLLPGLDYTRLYCQGLLELPL